MLKIKSSICAIALIALAASPALAAEIATVDTPYCVQLAADTPVAEVAEVVDVVLTAETSTADTILAHRTDHSRSLGIEPDVVNQKPEKNELVAAPSLALNMVARPLERYDKQTMRL